MNELLWKPNWPECRQRFIDWWNRKGALVGTWDGLPGLTPHEQLPPLDEPPLPEYFTNPVRRAAWEHYCLSRMAFPADMLPIASAYTGAGHLSLFLGSEPHFTPETVWFEPVLENHEEPEKLPPLRFDPNCRWWGITEDILSREVELGRGGSTSPTGARYLVGCPDLVENIDILSDLRGHQQLMVDLADRPEWVEKTVNEITTAWIEAFERIYQIIKAPDGSSTFDAFRIWSPGRTAKLQCDANALIGPEMFRQFVVPSLRQQCAHLDHSLFHLDGTQCIPHLDALFEIEDLDAIEWTPQPNVPDGGSPHWYDMYRRILKAGKCVQALNVKPNDILPLFDAIGTDGVYVLGRFKTIEQVETIEKALGR